MPSNKIDGFPLYRFAKLLSKSHEIDAFTDSFRADDFIKEQKKLLSVNQSHADPAHKALVEAVNKALNDALEANKLKSKQLEQNDKIFIKDALRAANEDLLRKGIFVRDKSFTIERNGPTAVTEETINSGVWNFDFKDQLQALINEKSSSSDMYEISDRNGFTLSFPGCERAESEAFEIAKAIQKKWGDFIRLSASQEDGNKLDIATLADNHTYHSQALEGKSLREGIFANNAVFFDFNNQDLEQEFAYIDYCDAEAEVMITGQFIKEHADEYDNLYQKWESTAKENCEDFDWGLTTTP